MLKKLLGLGLSFVLASLATQACDICGCAPGGALPGIVPGFRQNKFGISYQQSGFKLNHPQNLDGSIPPQERETFRSLVLDGRWYLTPRIQVTGVLPLRALDRTEGPGYSWKIADPQLGVNYLLLNTGDSVFRKYRQTLSVGTAVEVPISAQQKDLALHERSSKGAVGISLQAFYGLRIKNWGFRTDAAVLWFAKNPADEQAGARTTFQAGAYYLLSRPNWVLIPQLLLRHDRAGHDYLVNYLETMSGGSSSWVSASCGLIWKSTQLIVTGEIPLQQNLSAGYTHAMPRVSGQINYLLNYKGSRSGKK